MFEAALDAGAGDVESTEDGHEIIFAPDDFGDVRSALEEKFGEAEQADLTWRPQTTVPVDDDKVETLFKLIEVLDDNDDVQSVSANFEIDDAVLERLAG
jgi:transcriptional/translational regulatory protein YebC/TACO1